MDGSYYSKYLLNFLRESNDVRQYDDEFIDGRADLAAMTFEDERRAGATVDQAQEVAMQVLTDGLNVNRKYLEVIPETMKLLLGEDVTHTVTFEQLNRLINHMELLPEPLIYHPIIFVNADDEDTIIEVGFDAGDNAIFKIGGETKFICAEDYWNNVNFNDLQKFMFMSEEDKYYLLEGTYGGKCITNGYQKVISLKTHEDVDDYFESM